MASISNEWELNRPSLRRCSLLHPLLPDSPGSRYRPAGSQCRLRLGSRRCPAVPPQGGGWETGTVCQGDRYSYSQWNTRGGALGGSWCLHHVPWRRGRELCWSCSQSPTSPWGPSRLSPSEYTPGTLWRSPSQRKCPLNSPDRPPSTWISFQLSAHKRGKTGRSTNRRRRRMKYFCRKRNHSRGNSRDFQRPNWSISLTLLWPHWPTRLLFSWRRDIELPIMQECPIE